MKVLWNTVASAICDDKKKRAIIISILFINILKGSLFSIITPPWQAPDEPYYFTYTKILVEELRIPTPGETTAAGHPFLYPLVSSIPYLLGMPGGGTAQVFLIRLLGILLSTLVVWLAFKTAYVLFPRNTFVQILTPILVAFNPQYGFISASINSDVLLIFFSSLLLYLLVRTVVFSLNWQRSFGLLAVIGMGLLTKERFSLFFFPLFAIFAYELTRAIRSRFLPSAQNSHVLPFLFAGISSLILVKSQSVFFKLTGVQTEFLNLQGVVLPGVTRIPSSWISLKHLLFHQSYSRSFSQRMFEEFWGFFGWLQIPLSPAIYSALKFFCLAAASGLLLGLGKKIIYENREMRIQEDDEVELNGPSSTQRCVILLIFSAVILITFFAMAIYDITTGPPGQGGGQGRYLFPVIVPISILMSIGLSELFPQRIHKAAGMVLFLGFFLLNIASLIYFMVPFYYQGT